MSEAPNYEAVLADIDARIAKLQAARESIVEIMSLVGTPGPGGPGGSIAPDAFLKMSIPDATKKYLTNVRQKQSTQSIIEALEKGGLPRSKYSTVYNILTRRQNQIGDIINMQGDWALQEWYPNYRKKALTERIDDALAAAEDLEANAPKPKETAKSA